MTILVGGVGQLYQGDFDLGRLAAERLGAIELGPHVVVEDLHYGAVAVAQRLEELDPDAVILVGAVRRGRPAGTVERRVISAQPPDADAVQRAVSDAVTGYVDIDLVIDVGRGLQALPGRVVAIEVEPAQTEPAEALSPAGQEALERAVELAVTEVRRTPLFVVTERIGAALSDGHAAPSPALGAMQSLLDAVAVLDLHGRWGHLSRLRDAVRAAIAEGDTSEGMTHLDWGLWWGIVEEIDRLEKLEATLAG